MIGWGELWARLWRTVALALALGCLWPAAVWVAHFMFWWWWYFVPVVLLVGAAALEVGPWVRRRRHARQIQRREIARRRLQMRAADRVLRELYRDPLVASLQPRALDRRLGLG